MTATLWIKDGWGTQLTLGSDYSVQTVAGLGHVEPEYTLRAGPQQQGVSIVNVRRGARFISFNYSLVSADRATRWTDRTELPNMLANLEEDAIFGITYDDGSKRQADVRRAGGLTRPWGAKFGPRLTRDVCILMARDPFWYNPTAVIYAFAVGGGAGSYAWPVAWPISWGASIIDASETKRYDGTAPEYPVHEITGPATNLVLTNESTNDKLDFTGHTIAAAEVVTIDLTPGYKTVTSTGATVISDLTTDSDLLTWHLAPESEVIDGDNLLHVECSGATGGTKIMLTAYERYVAI